MIIYQEKMSSFSDLLLHSIASDFDSYRGNLLRDHGNLLQTRARAMSLSVRSADPNLRKEGGWRAHIRHVASWFFGFSSQFMRSPELVQRFECTGLLILNIIRPAENLAHYLTNCKMWVFEGLVIFYLWGRAGGQEVHFAGASFLKSWLAGSGGSFSDQRAISQLHKSQLTH